MRVVQSASVHYLGITYCNCIGTEWLFRSQILPYLSMIEMTQPMVQTASQT